MRRSSRFAPSLLLPVALSVARASLALAISLGAVGVAGAAPAQQKDAGPLKVGVLRLDWNDAARGRAVPVKVYYPAEVAERFPVILFSHGLGGTRETYEYLGRQWASHGYVAIHLQHLGSDDAVWRQAEEPAAAKTALARSVMNPRNAIDRARDVRFALDQLSALVKEGSSPLAARLDLSRIGLAGHSFGAWTTLAVAGEAMPQRGAVFEDDRIRAAIAMSAPITRALKAKGDVESAYGGIHIPILHMTGTEDVIPLNLAGGERGTLGARRGGAGGMGGRAGFGGGGLGGRRGFGPRGQGATGTGAAPQSGGANGSPAADRRIPYDHIDKADQYLVTFEGGDHMIFSGRPTASNRAARDQEFQDLIRWGTTVFWDAYLKDDPASKGWLTQGGFAAALGKDAKLEMKIKKP